MVRFGNFVKFESREDWQKNLVINLEEKDVTYAMAFGAIHHNGNLAPNSFPQFYKYTPSLDTHFAGDWYKCTREEMAKTIEENIETFKNILQIVLDK